MATLRVATTRSGDLQALGAAGQTTADAWRALRALLLRELSPAHADLLAEPVVNQARGEIDWYGEGEGEARRLSELPEPERAAVQARLDALVGDIRELALRLGASRADGDRFLAEMLGLALQVPGPDWVRVLGGQPVLVGWGHVRAGGGTAGVTLTGRGAPAAARPVMILPPPPSPYAAAAPRRGPLWAALAASLLAPLLAVFLLLRDPFAWFIVEVGACGITPGQLALAQGLQDETAREGVLRTEMARLLADAGGRRLECPPVQPPAPPPVPVPAPAPPPPPPPRPSQDAERAERQGGQRGKLQIILAWEDRNDLDLRVVCPNGTDINFIRRRACGGALDVDANGDQDRLTRTPVENVFFNEPQPGRYRVIVDPYAMRERASTPFRVTIRREGQPDEVVPGTAVNGRHNQLVTEVQVERP